MSGRANESPADALLLRRLDPTRSGGDRLAKQGIAQLTDAAQLCRTLLVSDRARVTVMPSMEIIANDVKCTHGATICDLDDEELFYLMSRGISKIMVSTKHTRKGTERPRCR